MFENINVWVCVEVTSKKLSSKSVSNMSSLSFICTTTSTTATTTTVLLLLFYGHYTGQPALAGTLSYELEDFVRAQFYCPHALAGGNHRIGIREMMLEFSVLLIAPYHQLVSLR